MKSRTALPSARNSGFDDVADVLEAALVEAGAHLLAGADRHGRLHHEDRAPVELRQLVDHRPDAREVGVAGVGRRRVDADEEELAVGDVVDVEREAEALAVALEQLRRRPSSWNGTSPRRERVDLLGDDVADHDVVAELGEAGARDEADPAGAEDADLRLWPWRGTLLAGC